MNDFYRGFEIERKSGIFQIIEAGRIVDDAASETAAYDRIDKILTDRRADDNAENARNYRR